MNNQSKVISKLVKRNCHLFMILLMFCNNAFAYVGPGAGVTMLGAMWGVIITIVLAVFGLLFWPIRSALKRKKNQKDQSTSNDDEKPSEQDID